uniref:RING-type domain-containing protein n=1 Tax=Meloidogyne enterolobii TaxID=390850 RepID=A0A6V7W348_MELEN|nr:unnamed protein product [Meloidogyne enterolobii]
MYTNKFVCIICSEALASNTMYTTLCGHVYHINCIENWIAQKKYCPKCWNTLNSNDIRQIFPDEKSLLHSGDVKIKTEQNVQINFDEKIELLQNELSNRQEQGNIEFKYPHFSSLILPFIGVIN